jgi:hypothetical protein
VKAVFSGKFKKVARNNNVPYDQNPNKYEINEMWLGEGFSPFEVVEILGLDRKQYDPASIGGIMKIMELYSTTAPN